MKRTELFETASSQGGDRVDRTDQLIIRPMPKAAGVAEQFVRFLCGQKGCCCLVDWDWSGQREIRRACHLPVLHRLWVHRSGYALGYMKPRRQDPAQLFFLSTAGDVLSIAEMDSSLTDVVKGENRWYVGSKTGALHAFTLSGRKLWRWRSPEFANPYHAVPLYVSSAGNRIVAGSGGVLYGLSFGGTEVWRTELPNLAETRYRIEVPDAGTGGTREVALERLGLSGTGLAESMEMRRLGQTFSTEQASWFGPECPLSLLSQEYERVVDQDVELELRLGSSICAETLVHVRGLGDLVLAGTSAGRVCFFDCQGTFLGDFVVGDGPACASVGFGGAAGAVHSSGVLTLFDRCRPVATVRLPDYYAELVAQGRNVLVWAWDRAWLVDGRGDLLWHGTFPRRIRTAFADEYSFSVLAGPLYRFQVRRRVSHPKETSTQTGTHWRACEHS